MIRRGLILLIVTRETDLPHDGPQQSVKWSGSARPGQVLYVVSSESRREKVLDWQSATVSDTAQRREIKSNERFKSLI